MHSSSLCEAHDQYIKQKKNHRDLILKSTDLGTVWILRIIVRAKYYTERKAGVSKYHGNSFI